MPQRPLLRSPLLTVLGTGVLLVACSSDDTLGGPVSPYKNAPGSTSTGSASGAGTSGGSSSSGNGATAAPTAAPTATAPAAGSGSTPPSTGSGGSSGGGETPAPSEDAGATPTAPPAPVAPAFTVAVDDAAPSINLADTTVVNVTITPQSWAGAVTLSATGLPADVTGAFDNATVDVTGTTPVTAKLTLTSIDASKPVATPFQIVGTVGQTVHDTPVTLTVKSYITIVLPTNADSIPTSLGPTVHITAPADIAANPVAINFLNKDSTPHEIHAENPKQGFAHGQGTFGQGKTDVPVRMVTVAGTYSWHLHDDPAPSAGGKGPAAASIVIK